MQWYDPLNNFMLLKRISYPVPNPLNVFELLTEQNKIYPPVIIGVAAWYYQIFIIETKNFFIKLYIYKCKSKCL
jgi:hypothetical protein